LYETFLDEIYIIVDMIVEHTRNIYTNVNFNI